MNGRLRERQRIDIWIKPSDTENLASSDLIVRRTAVWISRAVNFDLSMKILYIRADSKRHGSKRRGKKRSSTSTIHPGDVFGLLNNAIKDIINEIIHNLHCVIT